MVAILFGMLSVSTKRLHSLCRSDFGDAGIWLLSLASKTYSVRWVTLIIEVASFLFWGGEVQTYISWR